MNITDLRVNHLSRPMGFRTDPLYFSWKVTGYGEAKKQDWARIRIYQKDVCIYDSGCANKGSGLGMQVNVQLQPRTVYRWTAEVAADTKETAWAESVFETGKMDETWQGKWISSAADEPVLCVFQKIFTAEAVKTGRLYISSTVLYEVWLNGQKAGNEYLTTGHTPDGAWEIQSYDITALLKEGRNTLSIWMGQPDGQVICELYGDRKLLAWTEESWKYTGSPIIKADFRTGESYDARKEALLKQEENWKKCEIKSQNWKTRQKDTENEEKQKLRLLTDRSCLPICCKDVLGQTLLTTPGKEKVFDFGQYIAGWVEFKNRMPEGMMVRLTAGSLRDGVFSCDRTQASQFVYISAGKPEHVRPHFAVYRFRYMKIEVFEADGTPSSRIISNILTEWRGIHLRRDTDPIGTVRTGAEYVNRLYLNALWSRKNAMLDPLADIKQQDIPEVWKSICPDAEKKACHTSTMELLFKEDYPGWLYGVRKGATTLWDDWDTVTADQQRREKEINELKCSGYGHVECWLYSYICGIQLAEAENGRIQIQPHPDKRLGFASARLESRAGTIKSAWKYNPDQTITYKIQIPFNMEAEIILPDETLCVTTGCYTIRKKTGDVDTEKTAVKK